MFPLKSSSVGMIGIRIFRGTEDFLVSRQDKTRATVDIFGQQYSIVGSESAISRLVASIVDEKMRGNQY